MYDMPNVSLSLTEKVDGARVQHIRWGQPSPISLVLLVELGIGSWLL
jgi:hypothetical protein